jgi:DNA-binding MarR family transcriptional regulator
MDAMDDPDEFEPDAMWPPVRPTRIVPKVLVPIFGAYHSARHRLESAAREHGLDATEALVLTLIRTEPRCPPWAIRRRIGFPPSTLSSILERLEGAGHLTLSPSELNGQRFELELTTSGAIAADVADYAMAALESEIRGYTSPEERRGAIAVFEACRAIDRPGRPHP